MRNRTMGTRYLTRQMRFPFRLVCVSFAATPLVHSRDGVRQKPNFWGPLSTPVEFMDGTMRQVTITTQLMRDFGRISASSISCVLLLKTFPLGWTPNKVLTVDNVWMLVAHTHTLFTFTFHLHCHGATERQCVKQLLNTLIRPVGTSAPMRFT